MPIEIPPIVQPAPVPGEANAYCTDEDIATETNDFPSLVPPNQIDAYGTDGTIIQTNPWILTSASSDFVANAVQPASLVYLTRPEEIWGPDPGEVFAVVSADPADVHALTIRRIGRAPGQGEPPGYYNQDVSGIEFTIRTMLAQIREATAEIDRRYGISEFLTNAKSDIVPADWQKINRMCVYLVLAKRYLSISRTTTAPGAMDVWLVKADRYRKLFEEEASSLTIETAAGQISAPNRKYTRLFRI
jgi:hypothetical protein